jgi:cyclic beta-1,2-glucan synthetase
MSERWIVLGFYQDQSDADAVLQELQRQHLRGVVAIHHGADGGVTASRSGFPNRLTERYKHWVVRNETLIVVRARPRDLDRVRDTLRQGTASLPITFAFHAKHVYASALDPQLLRLPALSVEALRLAAGRLAAALRPGSSHSVRRQGLLRRLIASESDLKQVQQALADRVRAEQATSMSAVWLLDNAYILQEHIDDFRRNLPRRYYEELPVITEGPHAGLPRVYGIASELVTETDLRFDRDRVVTFLQSFQNVSPLTIGELWAIPLMLRLRLIECVRRLAIEVEQHECEREQADLWANRLLTAARQDPDRITPFLAALAREYPHPSPYLADQLLGYLCDEDGVLPALREWLETALGAPLAKVISQERLNQSTDQVALSNAITSLRQLSQVDWRDLFESLSHVEAMLELDPAGLYSRMDFTTRDHYRHAVEEIAKCAFASEVEVARQAQQLAEAGTDDLTRHIGYYLVDQGKDALELRSGCSPTSFRRLLRRAKTHAAPLYLSSIALITAGIIAACLRGAASAGTAPFPLLLLGLLALIPASELVIQVVNYLVTRLVPPVFLARMSFVTGIPEAYRTLVVVPMMLLTPESIRKEVENLEIRYLANPDSNLCFGLLSDFSDAPQSEMPDDVERLDVVVHGIEQLNARYGAGRFFLFHRKRLWSVGEGRWIGRERKRGKLEDLNRFLVGETGPTLDHLVRVGDVACLRGIRFVITLDSDTQLPRDTARHLVETLAHPLNRPRLSADGRLIERGYTIIQPSVRTSLPSATATLFSRLFTDASGTDPYMHTCSDVNQDLVGEGSYHGKGIYDLQTFHEVLSTRFPENHLLSHDLLEGAHVRVGLASDIELLDLFPADYLSYARRQHRWVRGDWQIVDWLLRRVPMADGEQEINRLSAFNRWKIADNLRRSLLPIVALALLAVGWCCSPIPTLVSLFVGIVLFLPPLTELVTRLSTRSRANLRVWRELGTSLLRAIISAALLPHEAVSTLDAIVRVWYRRLMSHRLLLEWETAQEAHRVSRNRQARLIGQLAWFSLGAVLVDIALYLLVPTADRAAQPFLALWIISPLLVAWMNTSPTTRSRAALDLPEVDRRLLRQTARQTWRFFSEFVGPQSNWLPPDNYQESLRVEVAQRTSPTNIGLGLLAPLAAHDFGYVTLDEVGDRTLATLQTLDRLERYEGHLLNWYDLQTLQPLAPSYVSMVDSGNLLGDLWALEQGFDDLRSGPVLSAVALPGMQDALDLLRQSAATVEMQGTRREKPLLGLEVLLNASPTSLEDLVPCLRAAVPLAALLVVMLHELGEADPAGAAGCYWAQQIECQVAAWNELIDRYLPWIEILAAPPVGGLLGLGADAHEWRRQALASAPSLRMLATGDVPGLRPLVALKHRAAELNLPTAVSAWLDTLAAAAGHAQSCADARMTQADCIVTKLQALADGMNMRFLYDLERRLFYTGYNVSERRMDPGHYDLLASEARLGSFIAIARGEVPVDHWWALGRPYGSTYGERVLLSWSGTMFEYLMPLLLTRSFENSMLDEACRAAVACQIAYGRQRNLPWGISEAAFSALDANKTYQYRAFGVPGLGIKRGLEEDLVVAPYASALALAVAPLAAAKNLGRLSHVGLHGPYGCYESIDYTRQHKPQGERGVIVYSYMAHHQGMILAAIDNVLHDTIWQRRFHRNPSVRATESLLYERIPHDPAMIAVNVEKEPIPKLAPLMTTPSEGHIGTPNTRTPKTNLLSNGAYSVMVTNAGGGYSQWHDIEITRWSADTTRDAAGTFCYLKDLETGAFWSNGYQPVRAVPQQVSVVFTADKAEFRRRDDDIETITEIVVAPDDDVEVRRITLTNRSARWRHIELTSYLEIALAPHNADRAHPAFSKLFVETEALPALDALLAWRRPRSDADAPLWAMHVSADDAGFEMYAQYETDRARFLGRGRAPDRPQAMELNAGGDLSNAAGSVLDPIFSLRRRVTLEPGQRVQIAFITGAAGSREAAVALATKYGDMQAANRALEMAWTHAQLELRHLRIHQDEAQLFQQLASHLLYPNALLRPVPERLAANTLGQSRLWAHGLSGDLPIMIVTIADVEDIDLVRQVLTAHTYWQQRGLKTDLMILNDEAASYDLPLQHLLVNLVAAQTQAAGTGQTGGVFLRQGSQVPDDERTLLLAAARVALVAARGPLSQQLGMPGQAVPLPPALMPGRRGTEEISPPLPFMELSYFNGLGGFTPDGREYAIYLGPGDQTPMPWINVMANPSFGALVSEAGSGFAWYGNSQTNRLTPWSNDPISDPCTDAIYLRDEDLAVVWTPTPLPIREEDAYRTRHGQGYTHCEHNSHNIEQVLTTFVPLDDAGGAPLRVQRLRLCNRSAHRRRLTVTFYCAWTLGTVREETQLHVVTEWDADAQVLLARNRYHADFGKRVAFVACNLPVASFSGDRTAFLGRNGVASAPAALTRTHLSGRIGAGLDPCATLQVVVELGPQETTEVVFLLGQAADAAEATALAERYRSLETVVQALQTTCAWWDNLLDTVQVETPDPAANLLLNRWLLYQDVSCRLWGRSAFYQSGGAYGFRDQLQDVMALVYSAPQLAREQILRAGARQFVEGDVQHWWHPPSGAGVRTRMTDDLLFLPFVTAHYVRVTGDAAILAEMLPFLEGKEGKPLAAQEQEAYFVPGVTAEKASLLEHCRRALAKGLTAGPHGLPLMGAGDWNDSLSRVGIAGKGESVWLAWFLIQVLHDFAGLLELQGEATVANSTDVNLTDVSSKEAGEWRERATRLAATVEAQAWDGEWYLRAYFDDGTALGSKQSVEAQIDSLPQSWGVICGAADPQRAALAMQAVEERLVRKEDRVVLLLTPPFERSQPDPGYIRGYPPGVRENGGQYTHGSLWVPLAFARQGKGDQAVALLRMMNPVEHAREPDAVQRYKVEPYVVAADVYELAGSIGRGGWTWYTGAAGWMYRVWLEEICGFRLRGDTLTLDPCIAAAWGGFTLRYRYRSARYEITVENPDHICRGVAAVELDGVAVADQTIRLKDDGLPHTVRVRMGENVSTGI